MFAGTNGIPSHHKGPFWPPRSQILLYPSAIGSEPSQPGYNSYPHWVRTQQGHAAANMVSTLCTLCLRPAWSWPKAST